MKNNIFSVCGDLFTLNNGSTCAAFIGKGNIWIDDTYDEPAITLARYAIYQALFKTAPGQLSVLGFDSNLSGLFAPFASLSAGGSKQLELISDEKELNAHLEYIKQQIQAVQNVIQGRSSSLTEFRQSTNRAVEGYKLVVLSMDMGVVSNEFICKLSLLMKSGPAAGISFLIISTTEMSIQGADGKDITRRIEFIDPKITVLEPTDPSDNVDLYSAPNDNELLNLDNTDEIIVNCKNGNKKSKSISVKKISAEEIIKFCGRFSENISNAELPSVSFDEIHDMPEFWKEKSTYGLTFTLGKYGVNNMDITIGDEINQRHNAVITGAVGQGKSNLISVIIHSLCLRYSPHELQLYLLDFKEGVTFKAFSNIGHEEYLPHARALGLESDVNFGISVFESLYSEYKRRMRLLKDHNVKSIRELRLKDPNIEMPRIVAIIDEFQMMFGDDAQTGLKVADLLEKSVRLFRAAGIHFILASQTLGGNIALAQKKDSIFSQIPIRIALKNSIAESQQTLGMTNPAAAFLRPREAIVNLDYGEISQNRKTIVAFADEKLLIPVRKTWWEKCIGVTKPPYVFESERRITIISAFNEIKALGGEIPAAYVGSFISIEGKNAVLPLPSEPGRNIAVIGTPDSGCNNAVGILQSAALSLALQHSSGSARFIFCDFDKRKEYPLFEKAMKEAGHNVENIAPSEFESVIKELTGRPESQERVYLFGLAMDRWIYQKDPYAQGSPLKEFVETAPLHGMHFIGWWIKAAAFNSQVAGYGSSEAFNSKIFLRIDEKTVQSLTGPLVKWQQQSNRALLSDSIELTEEVSFVPYSPLDGNNQ